MTTKKWTTATTEADSLKGMKKKRTEYDESGNHRAVAALVPETVNHTANKKGGEPKPAAFPYSLLLAT